MLSFHVPVRLAADDGLRAKVDDALVGLIKRCPGALLLKEDVVKEKLRYAIDVMRFPPSTVLAFPQYFTYAFEKRIKSRYGIIKAMEIRGMPLNSMLVRTDAEFERAVVRLAESPGQKDYVRY